jgi:threonine aldolase
MVFLKSSIDFVQLEEYLYKKGIIISGNRGKKIRLATHNDISRENIDQLVQYIKEFVNK